MRKNLLKNGPVTLNDVIYLFYRIYPTGFIDIRLLDIRLLDICLHDIRLLDIRLHDIRLHDIRLLDIRLHDIRSLSHFPKPLRSILMITGKITGKK